MNPRIVLLGIGIALSSAAADAHHSIAGDYDTRRQVTVEAVVAEFHFVNPHPFLTVEVAGETERWRMEMDNRGELSRIGVTAQTLRQGDRIVVSGNPSRTSTQGLYIRRLDRPADGFWYEQVGSSPRISRSRR